MINFDDFDKILIGIGESCELENDREMDFLDKLGRILEGRDYFIVNLCRDDFIYKTAINENKIVSPCGGYRYFQCVDDCAHELLPVSEAMRNSDIRPKCPHCGKEVVYNRLPMENYNEGGYLEQWQEYNKWLQTTINKRLLVLELGVGMKYPSVIRFPFEKLAMFNKKCHMYRVHPTLAFSTPEIQESCECVTCDPIEFLLDL